jgi:pyruvate dehydrogenase E1 component
MGELRERAGVTEGDEWAPFVDVDGVSADELAAFVDAAPFNVKEGPAGGRRAEGARWRRDLVDAEPPLPVPVEPFDAATERSARGGAVSTQVAFGNVMAEIGKSDALFADRIVTMAPDVATTTNLGAWVNRRGVWGQKAREDAFKKEGGLTLNKWALSPKGQHIELGIAENNLMTALAAAGLVVHHTGRRLLPVGTLYDPFIARGLGASLRSVCAVCRRYFVFPPVGLNDSSRYVSLTHSLDMILLPLMIRRAELRGVLRFALPSRRDA